MGARVKRPSPPLLGPAGLKTWREIVRTYELSPGELEVLRQVCATVDTIAWCHEQLASEPMVVAGSVGQSRPNPLLASLADQRRTLATLWRELSLPMPDEDQGQRRTPQATEAAQARWRAQRRSQGGQVASEQ
jgi:phage terminase small subunit